MSVHLYRGTGIAHQREGLPCQDHAVFHLCRNGNHVLACSDGCSSSRYAGHAAKANIQGTIEIFERINLDAFMNLPKEEQKKRILDSCLAEIQKCMDGSAHDLSEFCATLVFAVWSKPTGLLLLGNIGDGFIAQINLAARSAELLSAPEKMGASTHFSISGDAHEHLRLSTYQLKRQDYILLSSDGAYPLFFNRGSGSAEVGVLRFADFFHDSQFSLGSAINMFANIPMERLDDYGIGMFIHDGVDIASPHLEARPQSMEKDELKKLRPQKCPARNRRFITKKNYRKRHPRNSRICHRDSNLKKRRQ